MGADKSCIIIGKSDGMMDSLLVGAYDVRFIGLALRRIYRILLSIKEIYTLVYDYIIIVGTVDGVVDDLMLGTIDGSFDGVALVPYYILDHWR